MSSVSREGWGLSSRAVSPEEWGRPWQVREGVSVAREVCPLSSLAVVTPHSALSLGTATHLDVPLFPQGIDHAALDGSPTRPTDGDPRLVVAGQAVETPLHLPGIRRELLPAKHAA